MYLYVYEIYVPLGCDHLRPQGLLLNKLDSPIPKDAIQLHVKYQCIQTSGA